MAEKEITPEQPIEESDKVEERREPEAPEKEQPKEPWTKEQQAEYTRKTQELAELKKEAANEGFDSVREYLAHVKQQRDTFGNMVDSMKKTVNPEEKKPQKPKLDESSAVQFQAMLKADWTNYRLDQAEIPSDERYGYSEKDLMGFMEEHANVIADEYRAQRRKGEFPNYFAIAADMKAWRDSRGKSSRKPEKETDPLKAEKSAELPDSTATPEGKKLSQAELQRETLFPDTTTQE